MEKERVSKRYVCTLDEASLKKAREELNEIPSDRMAAIQALRDWIEKQPHLISSFEDWELLFFLRGAKFSQLRAREMIDGSLTMRTELRHWTCDIDTRDPKVLQVIRDGYALPLPKRTPEGCGVMLYNMGKLDTTTKRYSKADSIKAMFIVGSSLFRNELTQVHGVVMVFDFSDFTAKHMKAQMSDSKEVRKFHKMWQENRPGRMKAFHHYRSGLFFEAIMTIARPFLKKKTVDRIQLHDNLETLYKKVPMELLPEEYLPDDYKGPTIGTLQQLRENFIAEITTDEFRDDLLYRTSGRWGVDESKRPRKEDTAQQSFRKLNVD